MRGGKRIGAGRPKGIPNKRTLQFRKDVEESGLTPLEFMLGIMRDPVQPQKIRSDMAVAAAPYIHPRISAVELSGRDGKPIRQQIMALIVDGTKPITELGPETRHHLLPHDRP